MPVSTALEKSARDFCSKYNCKFDFDIFGASVEEFTFLRPVDGWIDVYKNVFERMYKQALESVASFSSITLDGEAMLDDFEYTLIRPYVNESDEEIKHKPYVGMDRISRLEYLTQLTKEAPSNSVELYAEKYKNGELSIKQMMSSVARNSAERGQCAEIVGYVQALETVNKSRSLAWRAVHPFKNNAEKRNSEQMKRTFIEQTRDGEKIYSEAIAAAYEPFVGYQKVSANLEERMIHAKEDMDRKQKMSDVMRESIRIEAFENEVPSERSPRVEAYKGPVKGKQI